jgi:hypothetical protein
VSQQGFPPGRSSRLPETGRSHRSSRHAGPSRDEESWNPEPWDSGPVDWPAEPGRQDVADRGAGAGYGPDDLGGQERAQPGRAQPGRSRAARPGASRPPRQSRPSRDTWLQSDPFSAADEADLPPWAGPSIHATRAGGTKLRPPAPELEEQAPASPDSPDRPGQRPRRRGRAAAARLRKSRRRVYVWCGSAIAVAVVIAGVAAIRGLHKPASHVGFVTTLQPGEFRSVPRACGSVSAALLSQSLPGKTRKVTPASTSGATSQCSFSVDSKPVFRVLEVTMQAYQPSAIPAGNGSATANAQDAFALTQLQLAHPAKKSPLPPAQIAPVPGLGQRAFSALQVIHSGPVTTDLVTVLGRDHNVVVTVSLQAQAGGNGFGPVSATDLRTEALAVARAVSAKAAQEPAVKG